MADDILELKQYTIEMERLANTIDKVTDKFIKMDQVEAQAFRNLPYSSYKEPVPATGMLSRVGKAQVGGSRGGGYYSNSALEGWYDYSLGRNQWGSGGEKLAPFPASDFKTSMAAKLKILEEAYNQETRATRNLAAIKERMSGSLGNSNTDDLRRQIQGWGLGNNPLSESANDPKTLLARLTEIRTKPSQNILGPLTDEQTRIGGDSRYTNALKMAGEAGLSIQNLQKISQGGTAGIEELTFAMSKNGEVTQRLTAYVDKLGNTTVKTGSGFRTFGQSLARNIESFAMWSIALAVVYAPLQKLNEALDSMIKTQTQLANVTIALGGVQKDVNDIFREASGIANSLGVSVSEIVDVYANAYRATASIADVNARTIVTNRLLSDSMLLAKLSGRSQAESLDDLVAAIEQTGVGLGNGQVLLDKWIRTTQLANVDLDTLVTSFGIVASAADNAGITIDELNGLIGATAQITNFSAKESGNFARALISGLQQEGVSDILKRIGIDLQDFTDSYQVFLEISERKKAGAIGTEDWKALTKALGGGTRRQAPTAAILENMDIAQSIAAESAKAHGQAESALEKQLGTVQTALTRLDNAFKSLAATMGMEGGMLDTIKVFADVLTTIINGLNGVIEATGTLIPQMAALGIAFAAINSSKIGGTLTDLGMTTAMKSGIPMIAGFGMSALNIGQSVLGGEKDKAIAQTIGGIIGTAAGAILGGPLGASIGSVIGTSAGGAFSGFLEVDDSMSGVIYDLWKESTEKGTEDGIISGHEKAQAKIAAYTMIGGEALSRFGIDNAPEWLKLATGKGIVTGMQAASAFNGLPSDETAGIIATLTARQMVLQKAASGSETDAEYQKRADQAKYWGMPVPTREGLTAEQQLELENLTKLLEYLKGLSFGTGELASKGGTPSIPGSNTPPLFEMPKGGISRYETLTKAQTQLLVKEANKELVDALKAAGASEEEVTAYLKSLEGALIETKEGWLSFEKGSSFDPSFLSQAFDRLVKAGTIPGQEMGVEKLSISSAQSGELKKYLNWSGNLLTGMGYQMKPEELGIIYSDYVTDVLHVDNMQLRLALERIAEIEQKQLDGMYNLPEGSTFWVPLGAMGLRPTGGGGGAEDIKTGGSLILRGAEIFAEAARAALLFGSMGAAGKPAATSGPNYNPYDPRTRPMTVDGLTGAPISAPTSGPGYNPYNPLTTPLKIGSVSASAGSSAAPVETTPIARIQLEIRDNITLTVDGRQMANVVKQYLWEDMVRAEKSGGGVQRKMIM
jgi:TP901 family phage tail tape measure protein